MNVDDILSKYEDEDINNNDDISTDSILSKYEEPQEEVDLTPRELRTEEFPRPEEEQPSPTVEGLKQAVSDIGEAVGQTAIGFVKEAGATGRSLLNLSRKAEDIEAKYNPLAKKAKDIRIYLEKKTGLTDYVEAIYSNDELFDLDNTYQKVGGSIKTALDFLAPSAPTAKAKKAVGLAIQGKGVLSKALRFMSRNAIEGVVSGGIRGLQTNASADEMKNAALYSMVIPEGVGVLSKATKAVLKKGGKVAEGIMAKMLGYDKKLMKNDLKISNVFKHDLADGIPEVVFKAQKKISDLYGKLKSVIKTSDSKINLTKVLDEVEDELLDDFYKYEKIGQSDVVDKTFYKIKEDIYNMTLQKEYIDLADAQMLKHSVGKGTKFTYGNSDDVVATRKDIFNKIYSKLKTNIENADTSGQVKILNDEMSEIIPIYKAALNKMPSAVKDEATLHDVLGTIMASHNHLLIPFVGLKKGLRSPTVAKYLKKSTDSLSDILTKLDETELMKRALQ